MTLTVLGLSVDGEALFRQTVRDPAVEAAAVATKHLVLWPLAVFVTVHAGKRILVRRRRAKSDGTPKNARLASLAPDRHVGQAVEVRWHFNGRQRGGGARAMWKAARIAAVHPDRSVTVKDEGWSKLGYPLTYAREDVRAPSKRPTTGKERGRGGPGGWV